MNQYSVPILYFSVWEDALWQSYIRYNYLSKVTNSYMQQKRLYMCVCVCINTDKSVCLCSASQSLNKYLWYLCGFSSQSEDIPGPSGSPWGLWRFEFHPKHRAPSSKQSQALTVSSAQAWWISTFHLPNESPVFWTVPQAQNPGVTNYICRRARIFLDRTLKWNEIKSHFLWLLFILQSSHGPLWMVGGPDLAHGLPVNYHCCTL